MVAWVNLSRSAYTIQLKQGCHRCADFKVLDDAVRCRYDAEDARTCKKR